MKDNKPKDQADMGPPRLTLVPKDETRAVNSDAADGVPPPFTDPEAGPQRPQAEVAANASASIETDGRAIANDDLSKREPTDPVAMLAAQDRREKLRIIEAVLFAAPEPMSEEQITMNLIEGDDIAALLAELQEIYAPRGINLTKVAGKWAFRTAEDLSFLLQRYAREERRLSKAALETLAIIAYHQPVTRAEIEEIRGVSTSVGTLDILLETGWIRPRGRRRAPGRPVTYGTTESFLDHFGLDTIKDLPGLAELKGAGLLDSTLPPGFIVPEPSDVAALMPDELPLEEREDNDAQGALALDNAAERDNGEPVASAPSVSGGDPAVEATATGARHALDDEGGQTPRACSDGDRDEPAL